jgi:hypothetical protein
MSLMKVRRLICLVFLLPGLMASCQQNAASTQTAVAPISLTTPYPSFDATVALSPTLESLTRNAQPSPATRTAIRLPDLLINTGPYLDECARTRPSQIWYFPYPYQEGSLLLSDPIISYYAPTWSPDGEWIAYIRSDPAYIEWMQGIPESVGTESIWIMHPDGSEAKQISANFPAWNYIDHTGFCVGHGSLITPSLEWSYDGSAISFRYISQVAPVTQGNIQVINLVNTPAVPAIEFPGVMDYWSPISKQLVIEAEQRVYLYELSDHGITLTLQAQYPDSSLVPYRLAWPATREHPIFMFMKPLPDVPYKEFFEIWEWNTSSGDWTRLLDRLGEDGYITNEPYLGERWGGYLTEDNILVIIDTSTWSLTEYSIPDEPVGGWGIIGWINDNQGNELLLIDSQSEVLYIRPSTNVITHGLLFDKRQLEIPDGYYLNAYAWKP